MTDKPLRGTQVLLQRLKNASEIADRLRLRIAELEATKQEHRFQVHVAAFMYSNLTRTEAEAKVKWWAENGLSRWVQIVEDP